MRNRTRQEVKRKNKVSSLAPLWCSFWDHWLHWNHSHLQNQLVQQHLFAHRYPGSLRNDCCWELAPQSAALFPATEIVSYTYASTFQLLLAQIKEVAQGISLGYASSDTKQHQRQRPRLQNNERTVPVRTELTPPEKYFNSQLFIVPFLSFRKCCHETDSSGDWSLPENPVHEAEVQPHGSANTLESPTGKLHCKPSWHVEVPPPSRPRLGPPVPCPPRQA